MLVTQLCDDCDYNCRIFAGKDNIAVFDLEDGEWIQDDAWYKPGPRQEIEAFVLAGYAAVPSRLFDSVCHWIDANEYHKLENDNEEFDGRSFVKVSSETLSSTYNETELDHDKWASFHCEREMYRIFICEEFTYC